MQIARFEPKTTVEGPGDRSAIWFQGCSIRCPGCCNPNMQTEDAGYHLDVNDLADRVIAADADGLTLLGGEPLDQAGELVSLLQQLKKAYEKGIILFTGYTWEQVQANELTRLVVSLCDLIIAGPFMAGQASESRRWIGSDNQTVHFITPYFADLQKSWPKNRREIEIILRDGVIMVNGTPLGHDHELSRMFAAGRED